MFEKPGQVLTSFLKSAIESSTLTHAQIAVATSIEETRLNALFAGEADMTIDEFVLLSQSLEITLEDLGLSLPPLPETAPTADNADANHETSGDDTQPGEAVMAVADAAGNQPAQIMQLGFGLGCDIFFIADCAKLSTCGLPEDILQRFPEQLPIRLNAAYHRHMAPSFLPEGLTLTLSFDALYTCTIPWDAFVQVTLFPRPFKSAPETPKSQRGHLRLVD